MTAVEIGLVAVIVGVGASLQSAVGFGMPLVTIPLLVLAGFELPVATSLVMGAALVQTAYGSWTTRALIRWKVAFTLAGVQWLTVFAGVACMALLVRADPGRVKQAVGLAVVVAVTVQWIARPRPRANPHPGWGIVAASAAGFFGGLVGIGGPPLVLYGMAHRWSPDDFRAFMWSIFLLALPVIELALVLRFGTRMLLWFGIGVAAAPGVWLGSRLGRALSARWESRQLRLAAMLVLYAIGLVALIGPLLA